MARLTASSRKRFRTRRVAAVKTALVIAVTSALLVYGLYYFDSRAYLPFRQVRTEFVFHPFGPRCCVISIFWVLAAMAAIEDRKALYFFPGVLMSLLLTPPVAWSGPGDLYQAIQPLIQFATMAPLMVSLMMWVLVWIHIVRLNRLNDEGSAKPYVQQTR